MKELIEFIVKSIVNNPSDVVVTEERSEGGVLLKLQVHADDMGVVQAMRTLLRIMAVKQNTRVELVVI
jgi:predicted RNA-binding protein YlqC (UPF0109 family)